MWVDSTVANAHHTGYSPSGAALAPFTRTARRVRSALLAVSAAAATAAVPSLRRLKKIHDHAALSVRLVASAAR
jgi:hypothetical protein